MNDRLPNWLHWTILGLTTGVTTRSPLLPLCVVASRMPKPN